MVDPLTLLEWLDTVFKILVSVGVLIGMLYTVYRVVIERPLQEAARGTRKEIREIRSEDLPEMEADLREDIRSLSQDVESTRSELREVSADVNSLRDAVVVLGKDHPDFDAGKLADETSQGSGPARFIRGETRWEGWSESAEAEPPEESDD